MLPKTPRTQKALSNLMQCCCLCFEQGWTRDPQKPLDLQSESWFESLFMSIELDSLAWLDRTCPILGDHRIITSQNGLGGKDLKDHLIPTSCQGLWAIWASGSRT